MEKNTHIELLSEDNKREEGGESDDILSLQDLDLGKTIGTGSFGRVCLCKNEKSSSYYALKIMPIQELVRHNQVEHTNNERKILKETDHPFIIPLKMCQKDSIFVYFLFPYECGGELFGYLQQLGRFSPETALFYSSEIVSALSYLHSLSIVYRDLKPENLLLDREGHIVITDFGFAKHVEDKTWTLCGTQDYLAPEIIQATGHNKAVDWWALGVLIFEMLTGFTPFYDQSPLTTYENILSGKVEFPRNVKPLEKDLIEKLLTQDHEKRLGSKERGSNEVKNHKWFQTVDWEDALCRKLQPPFIPCVSSDWDTSHFQKFEETDWGDVGPVSKKQQELFKEF